MLPITTARLAWSVGRSVMTVSPAKVAEPIEMPFGTWTHVGPMNHVLDGSNLHTQRGNLEGNTGPVQHMPRHISQSTYSKQLSRRQHQYSAGC